MFSARNNGAIVGSLLFATLLWGANNTGMKHLVLFWPPVFISSFRFLLCGGILLLLLHRTRWLGKPTGCPPAIRRQLWTRTGLCLAAYVIAFMVAIKLTSPANVALYLGASPIWALLFEGRSEKAGTLRWAAALLAIAGAGVLFWPKLKLGGNMWMGEAIGLTASVLWAVYGLLSRGLTQHLSGTELTAHSMWRAGVWMLPISLLELGSSGITWRVDAWLIFLYSVLGPGVFSFALWSNALKHWPTSQVYLFNNIIPVWTVFFTWLFFREPVTSHIWLALVLIVSGVVLSSTNWSGVLGKRWFPPE